MTALQFVEKWRDSSLGERQGAQSHFLDLCDLLGEPKPTDPESYCFERGAEKVGGGDGWADVWRKGCFAWEYKGKHANLAAALRQLQTYTLDLQMPPYLVVSDMERIIVHTNWNNTVSEKHEFTLGDLLDAQKRDLLRQVFIGSEKLKPTLSPQDLTAKAAQRFGDIGRRLQERGHDPRDVAHFLNRLIFCMFAEDSELLPKKLFSRMMKAVEKQPAAAAAQMADLFAKMQGGGFFGVESIAWFNGGLFDNKDVLPLEVIDLKEIAKTAEEHDWSEIDPAIFGTLFEQALKATRERPALGAHYTDRENILKIVDPVITRPLMAEWEIAHAEIAELMEEVRAADAGEKAIREEAAAEMAVDLKKAKAGEEARRKRTAALRRDRNKALSAATERLEVFLARLAAFRVLDPACGSGNFLYVALHALHDIERRAHGDVLRLGLEPPSLRVSVKQLRGIEIERYAAELARVTLWIGDLQWLKKNGYLPDRRPILDTLDQIEERDALLDRSKGDDPKDWPEAEWPETDVIIGNPPFVAARDMVPELGDTHVDRLRTVFQGRVPGECDFVCFWFDKALNAILRRQAEFAGLVCTNSLPRGVSRVVLDRMVATATIFDAWHDQPWTVSQQTRRPDKASVRVSMVCFAVQPPGGELRLDGAIVQRIGPDLVARTANALEFKIDHIKRLLENRGVANQGIIPRSEVRAGRRAILNIPDASFIAGPNDATKLLLASGNPNALPNSDVLRRYIVGEDIVDRVEVRFLLDFTGLSEERASEYEAPFSALGPVRAHRAAMNQPEALETWWLPWNNRDRLRDQLRALRTYCATPRNSKHRIFVMLDSRALPDCEVVAFGSSDWAFFGVLQSRFHEAWTLRTCSFYGVGNTPRYSHRSTFETFPFPEGLTPNLPASSYADDPRAIAIADAARELNEKREAWLNPPEWVERVAEVVPGYPDRIVAKAGHEADLKTRTLTKLYNERPAWLDHLHKKLDAAIAAAYGWPADLSDEDILAHLFALNQERAAAGR